MGAPRKRRITRLASRAVTAGRSTFQSEFDAAPSSLSPPNRSVRCLNHRSNSLICDCRLGPEIIAAAAPPGRPFRFPPIDRHRDPQRSKERYWTQLQRPAVPHRSSPYPSHRSTKDRDLFQPIRLHASPRTSTRSECPPARYPLSICAVPHPVEE